MDEKITQELLKYMNETKDFILQEAPDVIIQMMSYHKITAWMGLLFSVLVIMISIFIILYFCFYPSYDKYENITIITFLGRFIPISVILMFLLPVFQNVDDLIHIYIAPKHFIIKKIMK